MKGSPSQSYSYALDSAGSMIHISQAERDKQYFCPQCGGLMTPHMGAIRRWHFTHKANTENCNYETYLHRIAKTRIREVFLSASKFVISYDVSITCNKADCFRDRKNICSGTIKQFFDLKQYYDECTEEYEYNGFRADLLLSSTRNPDREPILIEIYVSHKSSDEKINTGVRIIEIKITSEEDIEDIISNLRDRKSVV